MLIVFGIGLFARRRWAAAGAIALAMLSGLVNFVAIPYYPVWWILVIALCVWVIWSLTRPGAILLTLTCRAIRRRSKDRSE